MHTRIGVSSSMGSGVSVGSIVTVGLGTSSWLSDQMVALVPCSVEQYAVVPSAVVAVLPAGEQSAPMTAGGGDAVVVVWWSGCPTAAVPAPGEAPAGSPMSW